MPLRDEMVAHTIITGHVPKDGELLVTTLPEYSHPGRFYASEADVVQLPPLDIVGELVKAPPAPPPTSRIGRTIVNIGKRVGRNARCPCGSGLRTKRCHKNAVLRDV